MEFLRTLRLHTRYIQQDNVRLFKATYVNGNTALILESEQGEPLGKATTNIFELDLPDDQVLIKNTQENEGLLEALERAKVLERTRPVPVGHITAWLCRLI